MTLCNTFSRYKPTFPFVRRCCIHPQGVPLLPQSNFPKGLYKYRVKFSLSLIRKIKASIIIPSPLLILYFCRYTLDVSIYSFHPIVPSYVVFKTNKGTCAGTGGIAPESSSLGFFFFQEGKKRRERKPLDFFVAFFTARRFFFPSHFI